MGVPTDRYVTLASGTWAPFVGVVLGAILAVAVAGLATRRAVLGGNLVSGATLVAASPPVVVTRCRRAQ